MRPLLKRVEQERAYRSPLLHPLALLGIWLAVGFLFALQEFSELRHTSYPIKLSASFKLWSIYSSLGATGFILTWHWLRKRLDTAGWRFYLFAMLPLSFVLAVVEEMLYVVIFPHFVAPRVQRGYWERLVMVLRGDFFTNMAFFWIATFIARGVSYYEGFRQKEITTSRLETELVGAQLRALRMQLNPHFLFNTMNGISSLMRADVDAADQMLEQLSRLLRMTLDRGDVQEVSLREEIEFIQLYLEIQRGRFGDRVRYEIDIAPKTLDALVPTMILQPVVENAYRHGVATSHQAGVIWISSALAGGDLLLRVKNTGTGLKQSVSGEPDRVGIGVANVRARLELHHSDRHSFTLREVSPGITEALLTLPFKLASPEANQSKKGLDA